MFEKNGFVQLLKTKKCKKKTQNLYPSLVKLHFLGAQLNTFLEIPQYIFILFSEFIPSTWTSEEGFSPRVQYYYSITHYMYCSRTDAGEEQR